MIGNRNAIGDRHLFVVEGRQSARTCSQLQVSISGLQLDPQRLARAREPRLDGPHRQSERECDLFVLQPFDLPQHECRSLLERQFLNRRFQPRADLLSRELAIGRRRVGAEHYLAVISDVLVERHLIRPLTAPPPALPVPHLIDDDPEYPGAQRRLPAEAVQRAEDAQEHLLRHIERFFAVAEQMRREPEYKTMMLEDQCGMGGVVPGEHRSMSAASPLATSTTNQ